MTQQMSKAQKIAALKTNDIKTDAKATLDGEKAEAISKGDVEELNRLNSIMPPTDPKKILLDYRLQRTSSGSVHGVIMKIVDEDEISDMIDKKEADIDAQGNIIYANPPPLQSAGC